MEKDVNMSLMALKCICLDYIIENPRLHYGRFVVSPLEPGQAITLGTAIRRALLGDIETTYITSVEVIGASHEYSTLPGIRESVHDILLNLKEIVLKSQIRKQKQGIILFQGPGVVTAEHIQLPSSIQVVDKSQYIAKVESSIQLEICINVDKSRGWQIKQNDLSQKNIFSLNGIIKPIRNVNYSIHSLEKNQLLQEILVIEIWTNGSLTPQEAIVEASYSLTKLCKPLLNFSKISKQSKDLKKQNFLFSDQLNSLNPNDIIPFYTSDNQLNDFEKLSKNVKQETINVLADINIEDNIANQKNKFDISIDSLHLSARASNCLRNAGIYTVIQLLNYSQEDLMKLKNLGKKSAEQIILALKEHFDFYMPYNKID